MPWLTLTLQAGFEPGFDIWRPTMASNTPRTANPQAKKAAPLDSVEVDMLEKAHMDKVFEILARLEAAFSLMAPFIREEFPELATIGEGGHTPLGIVERFGITLTARLHDAFRLLDEADCGSATLPRQHVA